MKIFGLEITRAKTRQKLQSIDDRGWTRIFDWKPGTFQTHHPYDTDKSPLSYPTVFSCQTLIASDIAKLKICIEREKNGIWSPVEHPLNALLKRPNDYQNHMQFKESWILSKLSFGNAYIYKTFDQFGNQQLHVLDPLKVTPYIADNGDVFYRLNSDYLAKLEIGQIVVPATEIIHDRFNCLYHPMVGLSPIFAASKTSNTGLTNLKNMDEFFANGSNPGGVLTAPGPISDGTAKRLKEYWNENFKGKKTGEIAVAGDGLKFEPMRMSNVDSQLIEIMDWNDSKITSVYHVPAHMVGVGDKPSTGNLNADIKAYYSQCLQVLIEAMELALDEGLGVPEHHRVQLDINTGLFRMDTKTQLEVLDIGSKAGIYSPDEARKAVNLAPVPGGQYPYLQQQNYSLEALSKRDQANPLAEQPVVSNEDVEQSLRVFDILTKNKTFH